MTVFQWSESTERPRLSEEQKKVAFQAILQRSGHADSLPDFRRIVRRAEAKADKAKTALTKLRHLNHAIAELDLIRREAIAKFRSLETNGAIDDPEAFWDYIESLELAGVSLQQQTESLALEWEDKPMTEQFRETALCHETEAPILSSASEIMDVDEVSVYLKVSKSTIYHLSAAGGIPVSRIGARLTFRKVDIDIWLAATA